MPRRRSRHRRRARRERDRRVPAPRVRDDAGPVQARAGRGVHARRLLRHRRSRLRREGARVLHGPPQGHDQDEGRQRGARRGRGRAQRPPRGAHLLRRRTPARRLRRGGGRRGRARGRSHRRRRCRWWRSAGACCRPTRCPTTDRGAPLRRGPAAVERQARPSRGQSRCWPSATPQRAATSSSTSATARGSPPGARVAFTPAAATPRPTRRASGA